MPTSQTVTYPLVNGIRYDFSAIQLLASGVPLPGVNAINYSQELKGGEIRQNSPQLLGMTRGQLKCTASLDIYEDEYQNLLIAVCALNGTPGSGFMEARFDVQVLKQDGTGLNIGPLYADVIKGFKIGKVDHAYKSGPEGLLTKVESDQPFYIIENGQLPIGINPSNLHFIPG
jgi:hypothetical protein